MEPPINHAFKLNTDGFCLGNLGKGRIGGIVRSSNEGWVMGFSRSFHNTTNNMMKLFALIEGIKMVEVNNILPFEINVDSLKIISMLSNSNLHYDALILDCRLRLKRLENPKVGHCYRDQNGVADALAKEGARTCRFNEITFFEVPPVYAKNAVWADISGGGCNLTSCFF
ncbi:ribonuclease H-like [Capsicum annuum]|uniref:ribonuclease H-like n=1 Tax=Capsicum annuum TaxID=4072 RepID=UPI001FB1498E|nr:ribonuclease H-like [Capsicum annuum]